MTIEVYYDGACPLCRREINSYRRIAPSGAFAWRDIAADPAPLAALGVTRAEALRRLHVRGADGALRTGVDGFVEIWRALPYWRRLAPVAAAPGVRHVAGWLYERFAAWRFRRLAHCRAASAADRRGA